jgi:hypothetical protein
MIVNMLVFNLMKLVNGCNVFVYLKISSLINLETSSLFIHIGNKEENLPKSVESMWLLKRRMDSPVFSRKTTLKSKCDGFSLKF